MEPHLMEQTKVLSVTVGGLDADASNGHGKYD
jgi:hypothetical protein